MARLSVLNTKQFAAAAALTVLALPAIGHAQEQREHRRGEQGAPTVAPVAPQTQPQPQVQAPAAAPVRAPVSAQPQPSGAFRWQRPTGAAAPIGAPAAPQPGRMGVVVQQQVAPAPATPTPQGWNNRGAWQGGNPGQVRAGESQQRNEPQRNPGGNWQGNSQQGGNWRNERGDNPQFRNRNDQHDRNDRNDHGWQRGQQGDARNWNRDWQRDNRYNWRGWREDHRESFHIGRYSAPYRGYAYRRLNLGFFLEPLFFGQQYVIYDPWVYHLPPAYGPYEWVRYYDDAVLVDRDTGRVVDVIYDFFW